MTHQDMALTYGVLMLSIASLWLPAPHRELNTVGYWAVLLLISLVAGLAAGFVNPMAVLLSAAFGLACYLWARPSHQAVKVSAGVLIVVFSVGFMAHLVPGFANPQAISDAVLSPGGMPYTQYWTFDKALVGLFLLAFCHPLLRTRAEWLALGKATLTRAAIVISVVMITALAVGYVQFDMKFPALFLVWASINLFFTCVAEEAFFRGFVQKGLENSLERFRYGSFLAFITASVLFGVAHFMGGLRYVFLATLAGLGYGWVYQQTKRIEASILTHFSLNSVHFLFFTYPALKAPI
jgi:membrane protease YdiL (CAAX protease family)